MNKLCKDTCPYALDIAIGIGAPTEAPKTHRQDLIDKLNKIIDERDMHGQY